MVCVSYHRYVIFCAVRPPTKSLYPLLPFLHSLFLSFVLFFSVASLIWSHSLLLRRINQHPLRYLSTVGSIHIVGHIHIDVFFFLRLPPSLPRLFGFVIVFHPVVVRTTPRPTSPPIGLPAMTTHLHRLTCTTRRATS